MVADVVGKVLVFMDTCHSSNLKGKIKQRGMACGQLRDQQDGKCLKKSCGLLLSHKKAVRPGGEQGVGQ